MRSKPTVIVTCGPAISPIDEVRFISNRATGEIGTLLSNALVKAGWKVICLRGEGSTASPPTVGGLTVRTFSTNENLQKSIEELAQRERVGAVFHAAALTDFSVKTAKRNGVELAKDGKWESGFETVSLELEPSVKVLPRLREMLPDAWLVGWKYELNGDRESVILRGKDQLKNAKTDACVVNGRAYGTGFGVVEATGWHGHFTDKADLACELVRRLASG